MVISARGTAVTKIGGFANNCNDVNSESDDCVRNPLGGLSWIWNGILEAARVRL